MSQGKFYLKTFKRGIPLWFKNEIVMPLSKGIKSEAKFIVLFLVLASIYIAQAFMFGKIFGMFDEVNDVFKIYFGSIILTISIGYLTYVEFLIAYGFIKLFKRIYAYGNRNN